MAIKDDIKEIIDDVHDKINNIEEIIDDVHDKINNIEERVRYLEINNASQTESINNIKEGLDEIKDSVKSMGNNVESLGNNMTINLNSILSSINGLLTSNAKIEVAKIEKDGKVGTQKLIFWGMVVTTAISVFGTIYVSYAK